MLRSHPSDATQILRVAVPTPNNGIPLKRFYAAIATAKKINRKSSITYPNLSQPCSVHRRIASKCIASDRIGALEARTHAIISGMIRIARLRFFIFCVKTLNGGHGRFRFHIELDLPHATINILWRGGRMDRAQMDLLAGGAL
jgi:hypothetical protein